MNFVLWTLNILMNVNCYRRYLGDPGHNPINLEPSTPDTVTIGLHMNLVHNVPRSILKFMFSATFNVKCDPKIEYDYCVVRILKCD